MHTRPTSQMDVNLLLQTRTLSELKEEEKKLRSDVERKKEDLRQLVATRYRELIDAADKIRGMRDSISTVAAELNSVKVPHQQDVSRRSNNDSTKNPARHRDISADSVNLDAFVARLFHIAPEVISKSLDSGALPNAAIFFAFVKNVGWHLNVGSGSVSRHQKWMFLRPYGDFILDCARSLFRKIRYEQNELSRYVSTIVILDAKATPSAIVSDFLERRHSVINELISNATTSSVKDTVEMALPCIFATYRGVYEVFIARNLLDFLEEEVAGMREWIYSTVFDGNDSNIPAEFPASFEEILSSIGPDRDIWTDGKHVQGAMVPWTDVVVAMVETSLNRLLECLPSVQSLLLVRKAMADSLSEELRKVPSLKFIGKELGIQISAVYDRFDLSTKARLRVLISDRLNLLLSKLETHLREAIFSNETKDLHMDMVASLKGIKLGGPRLAVRSRFPGSSTPQSFNRKSRSFSLPHAIDMIQNDLMQLWIDMKYIQDSSDSMWINEEIGFAYSYFFKNLAILVDWISGECEQPHLSLSLRTLYQFLRLLVHEKISLVHHTIPDLAKRSVYDIIMREAVVCCDALFQKWLALTMQCWGAALLAQLTEDLDPVVWSLKLQPFQKNFVEETNEAGEVVKYVLSVPMKASISFHQAIKSVHDQLISFGCGDSDAFASEAAINKCFATMIKAYEDLLSRPTRLTKNQALQLSFDLKIILAFGRARKSFMLSLVRSLQALVQKVSEFVDPIDYNILLPYLDRNVASHAASIRNLYFSLTVLDSGQSVAGVVSTTDTLKFTVVQFKPISFSQLAVAKPPDLRKE